MDHLLLCVCIVNFGFFFWSIFGIFKPAEGQSIWGFLSLRTLSPLTWFSSLWAISHSPISLVGESLGVFIQIAAFALFWWAFRTVHAKTLTVVFSRDLPTKLITSGPYEWIRHPFYTSYICSYFGIAWVTDNAWVWVFSGLTFAMYIVAANYEEKKFMASELSHAYIQYQNSTGRFLPRLFYPKRKAKIDLADRNDLF